MNRVMYFIITCAVWLLLTWSLDVQNIVAGIIIAFLCTVFIGHLFFDNTVKCAEHTGNTDNIRLIFTYNIN